MPEQIKALQPTASFEYELFEGDPDHLRTVVATPTQVVPWIDAAELKLKHRIGRGTFGDFWLATHHQSGADFEEYHEVAVKMLHPFDDEFIQKFKNKFERLFLKLREIPGVCWLHGLSVINNQLCIAMKFYEGSIADRMAWLKGGRLQLSDVLRYGINLANAILELHSIGMLVLNLKASNFLLNEHDQAVLGDFGIPYLLLGIPLLNSNMTLRIGTPNYMAPEQWEPEIRGPIAVETDSWGFGCSIVEMLTGVPPWFGKSNEEIYQSVVGKKEKPQIPSGLPPAVESVLIGCFEYDLRNRPVMEDIVYVFESSQKAVYSDEGRIGLESRAITEKVSCDGYTSWYLSKDHLQVGDTVRSRKPLNAQRLQTMDVPRGTVVGLDGDSGRTGFVLVKVNGIQNPLRVHESKLERVTKGFTVGDWVCLKEECSKHSSIGILHSIHRDGGVVVAFMGLETLWQGNYSQLQMAKPYYIGQFVRLKSDMLSSKFEWPRKRGGGWAVGRITNVLPNGCLIVHFPGKFPLGNESNTFLADPAEVELVTFDSCPGLVKKYQHVEDFHWAVRPLAIALGLFTTVKISIALGQTVSTKLRRKDQKSGDGKDSQAGSATWLPPPVANILFKDGVPTATIR